MKKQQLRGLLELATLAAVIQVVTPAHAELPEQSGALPLQLATGQYITPTFIRGSVQQFRPRACADEVEGSSTRRKDCLRAIQFSR
jgi:hypothetical protein